MKLCNIGHKFDYELEKLIRIFLPFEKIEIVYDYCTDDKSAVCVLEEKENETFALVSLKYNSAFADSRCKIQSKYSEPFSKTCERALATELYSCFKKITLYEPLWGILTGVRPAKLFSKCVKEMGKDKAEKYFKDELKVSDKKISLCKSSVEGEEKIISLSRPDSFSLYLSVPFCPTRCSYCSFVSHSVDKAEKIIPQYVDLLCEELKYTAKIASKLNLRLETVYMGGGTPTTLSAEQINKVLKTVNSNFDLSNLREYTVEAGRPDTISEDKLLAIKENNATRISINPQTMNDSVLETIGRNHTSKQTVDAFSLARKCGFNNINMDLIAGLPSDTVESFCDTLDKIIKLAPESVTVHSLSMKKASTLSVNKEFPEINAGKNAGIMVDTARDVLTKNGIMPYYMYRQSKTVGNLENVGYAKAGYEGLYNVYIMDETHSVFACGASAVTKLKEPNGSYISRIFNFKYPYEYISRFEEQIERKKGIGEFYEKYNGTYK